MTWQTLKPVSALQVIIGSYPHGDGTFDKANDFQSVVVDGAWTMGLATAKLHAGQVAYIVPAAKGEASCDLILSGLQGALPATCTSPHSLTQFHTVLYVTIPLLLCCMSRTVVLFCRERTSPPAINLFTVPHGRKHPHGKACAHPCTGPTLASLNRACAACRQLIPGPRWLNQSARVLL